MAEQSDVERIVLALPETATDDGHSFSVSGKGLVWPWRERVHPKKTKVPRLDVLVVPVATEGDKLALIESNGDVFFTEPHYDGYASVLVRIAAVDADELAELIADAWRLKAPKALVARRDEGGG